jgi:hypothetical protein
MEQIIDEGNHTGERSQFSKQFHCCCPPCRKDSNSHGAMTIFIYSFMDMYINQINFTPFYLKNHVKSCLITIRRISCYLCNDISLEEGLSALAKTYQNGKNLMADNSTMTDRNGKVSIHLGSSWLKLSNYVCKHKCFLYRSTSW